MDQGYVQLYVGDGKGKTTAALGQAMRAVGAGLRVYIGQFVKNMEYHEVRVLRERFPEVTVEQYGPKEGCFIFREPSQADIDAAQAGLLRATAVLRSADYDMVILDEIHIALYYHLISEEQALQLLDIRPPRTELVLTGRYAPQSLLARADLISEVRCVRHYYEQGVAARDGIER